MVAQPRRQHLSLPVAPAIGAALGLGAALAVALMPTAMIEDYLIASGLPQLMPAAAPPLGNTARLGLMLVAAGMVGLTAWFLLFLVFGARAVYFRGAKPAADSPAVPVLRRADAHPDAPARRPLFASEELGTPFLDISAAPKEARAPLPQVAEPVTPPPAPRDIPADLDTPLSAFDPTAIPEVPLTPPPAVKPLAVRVVAPAAAVAVTKAEETPDEPAAHAALRAPTALAPGERLETFELTPMVRGDTAPPPRPSARSVDTETTIASLLDRLERSVQDREAKRAAAAKARSIDETLGELRALAMRAQ